MSWYHIWNRTVVKDEPQPAPPKEQPVKVLVLNVPQTMNAVTYMTTKLVKERDAIDKLNYWVKKELEILLREVTDNGKTTFTATAGSDVDWIFERTLFEKLKTILWEKGFDLRSSRHGDYVYGDDTITISIRGSNDW